MNLARYLPSPPTPPPQVVEGRPAAGQCGHHLPSPACGRGGGGEGALPLPELAADMVARMGLADTLQIVERLGGLTVRIAVPHTPADKPPRAPLSRLLGEPLECALHRHYASEILYIPRCTQLLAQQRNRAIHSEFEALLRQGKSARSIVAHLARQFQLSDRRIWDILKLPLTGETSPDQPSLF